MIQLQIYQIQPLKKDITMTFLRKFLPFGLLLICFSYEIIACEKHHEENEILKQVFVENARARQGMKDRNTAIYFSINNKSKKDIVILGGKTTEGLGKIELHEVIKEDGVAKMRSIDKIIIPSAAEIVFKPGDLHFMILGLTKELKDGDKFKFAIETDAGLKYFDVVVQEKIN